MTVINSLKNDCHLLFKNDSHKKRNIKMKRNTYIQKEIRKKKKEDGIIKVTLELNKEQYKLLNKMSRFLLQGNISPGQKKVIKTYSEIFIHIIKNYQRQIPEKKITKGFYRRCLVAQFYKDIPNLSNSQIIEKLNELENKQNDKSVNLSNPIYYSENKLNLNKNTKSNKKWDENILKRSLDSNFINENIEKLNSISDK